jgi:cell division protein FtsL
MAARQDQTLQIFLIIFIFAFLVTAVVAYLGWRGYSEASATVTSLNTKMQEKNTENQNQKTELEDLRQVIGFGRNDNAADVKKATEEDMKTYGGSVADENSRTYRKVLETVFNEGQATAAREAKTKSEKKVVEERLTAKENETKAMIEKYNAQAKKAQEDAQTQQIGFNEYRKSLDAAQDGLKKSLADQRTHYETQITDKDGQIKTLHDQVGKLEKANRNLIDTRKDEPGSSEVADGKIMYVNQSGLVWINLGTADSLRRQVTFSVFDADQHDAAKATKKGTLEVTKLMSDHMAEARITSDDPKNPMLPGDNIYSQVWHRGKQLHFALAGVVDIDNDGQSDLELARALIAQNGGILDAYETDDGKVQGELTAITRYLVLGDIPDSTVHGAMQAKFFEMSKTASGYGVQTITLPQFLDQMGYRPQERTVRLGTGSNASDFPVRASDTDGNGSTPSNRPPVFRPRAEKKTEGSAVSPGTATEPSK